MALILAVNPGSTQSATLARVARQLHGHELIGADSCAIAMKALDQRMPALVLLPSTASKGEAELLRRLAPSRVPSLRLPSPISVDPRALETLQAVVLEKVVLPSLMGRGRTQPALVPVSELPLHKGMVGWLAATRKVRDAMLIGVHGRTTPTAQIPLLRPRLVKNYFCDVYTMSDIRHCCRCQQFRGTLSKRWVF